VQILDGTKCEAMRTTKPATRQSDRGMFRLLFLTCAEDQPLAVRVAVFGGLSVSATFAFDLVLIEGADSPQLLACRMRSLREARFCFSLLRVRLIVSLIAKYVHIVLL
jgi:hypothetical protein